MPQLGIEPEFTAQELDSLVTRSLIDFSRSTWTKKSDSAKKRWIKKTKGRDPTVFIAKILLIINEI